MSTSFLLRHPDGTSYVRGGDVFRAGVATPVVHAFPTITTEIAFSSNPGDAVPVWTDVSAYVREIGGIDTGRDSEFDDTFRAGVATLTLSNIDRRFEPEYAASPHYPNVVPGRRIRIRATHNAITYYLFTGYIERWPLTHEDPSEATVTITASDAFVPLAAADLPASVWEIEVMADNPSMWYRLGESSGTVPFNSAHGHPTPSDFYAGGVTFNSRAGAVAFDPDASLEFDGATQYASVQSILSGAVPFTIEFWIKTTQTTQGMVIAQGGFGLGDLECAINTPSGAGLIRCRTPYFGGTTCVSTSVVNDGQWHNVMFTVAAVTGDGTLYIDGVLESTDGGSHGGGGGNTFASFDGNSPLTIGQHSSIDFYAGLIDEVAVYGVPLAAGRAAAHYSAGTTPWAGQTSGTRVDAILDAVGWPSGDRDVDVGNSMLQSTALGGKALTYLQRIARSEDGALWITVDGKVRFRSRQAVLVPPGTTSQATFGDGGGAEIDYSGFLPTMDIDRVRNVVRRARVGGSVIVVQDNVSKARYFTHSDEITDMLVDTDATVLDSAYWRLAHRKDPLLRFEAMELEPYGDEVAHYAQMLGRKIGDRITVIRRPPGGGTSIMKDVMIEGISQQPGPDVQWLTKWRLSAVDTGAYWVWDASLWNSTTRWAY